ncbi:histone-fold-containing protein [Martensiomyces pterosporus]|nr:histone-fold-containing protein [Martensiomyces pterosporus]
MQNAHGGEGQLNVGPNGVQGAAGDGSLDQQAMHDPSGLGKFNLQDADYHSQSIANAVAAAAAAAQQQQQPPRSPAPMYPGPSTIPTNFSSGQINSAEALQQFQTTFWKAHMASIEDNVPDFKNHLLPLARIKKVMKSDPDVKVQMISAEAPILFSKACEVFITEITQRAWMNAEENKRRTLQRQDVSFAAQRSEMFDFLIDVVPREEFANKKTGPAKEEHVAAAVPSAQPSVNPQQANQNATAVASAVQQQQASAAPQPGVAQVQQQQAQTQQQAQQQAQTQPNAFYNESALHQYYAQQLAEAAGFPQAAAATPEQRQAYYQQIEREQFQWLQRQTNMGVPQQNAPQALPGQFGSPRVSAGINEGTPLSAQAQQHAQAGISHPQDLSGLKTESEQPIE